MGAWAAPREDELGEVRYKPEELGLYIDDPHATLKPEQQRCTGPGTSLHTTTMPTVEMLYVYDLAGPTSRPSVMWEYVCPNMCWNRFWKYKPQYKPK